MTHYTRLHREVAIKLLPEMLAGDPGRLERLRREARVLAQLSHRNIAAIHGVEEAAGQFALVMEIAAGMTLAERVAQGPMPLDEALPIAKQIAEALEAAHEKGIIHRDLKPANIKVSNDGNVKLLDFGLAKAIEGDPAPPVVTDNSPTLTVAASQSGVILGTAAYMSPEQARGRPVDRRSDIWAFAVVLYEMLTGNRLFRRGTVSDSLAAVLTADVDFSGLPPDTPPSIRRLLRRCLDRDRRRRLQAIGEARITIEDALSGGSEEPAPSPPGPRVRPWQLATIATALFAVAIAAWLYPRSGPPTPVIRFQFDVPFVAGFGHTSSYIQQPNVAISPAGDNIAYVAMRDGGQQVFLRRMDELESKPIPGTDDARMPFFSPDGESLAFFTGRQLKKVSLDTGAITAICDVLPMALAGQWGPDDRILFGGGPTQGLLRVSANGGTPEVLTSPDREQDEIGHYRARLLPGGDTVLFSIRHSGGWGPARIGAIELSTGKRKTLVESGTAPHYLDSGHLVFAQASALYAVRFDIATLRIEGAPRKVLDDVMPGPGSEFSLSADGSLIYVVGTTDWLRGRPVLLDRDGTESPTKFPPAIYQGVRLSPDGRRIAVAIGSVGDLDFGAWVGDLARGTLRPVYDERGWDGIGVWTPDGLQNIIAAGNAPDLARISADASGTLERLLEMEYAQFPTSCSRDGRYVLFTHEHPATKLDVLCLPLDADRKPFPIAASDFSEAAGSFSPDSRWIAYQSDHTGEYEIYVRPFQGSGETRVSTDGGTEPAWAGNELFFRNGDTMMAVSYTATDDEFLPSTPYLLFEGVYSAGRLTSNYDVTPDGRRFIMIKLLSDSRTAPLVVVRNWAREVERLMEQQ